MQQTAFDDLITAQIKEAEVRGIVIPVLAAFAENSLPATAMYGEVTGKPIPRVADTRSSFVGGVLALSRSEAGALLRRHAGKGGIAVADVLENPVIQPACWQLHLLPGRIWVDFETQSGLPLLSAKTGYDVVSEEFQFLRDPGRPSIRTFTMDDGIRVTVCGANGVELALAWMLAMIVATGRFPDGVPFPVTDGHILSALKYRYAEYPSAVKEAIQALRKLPGHKDRRLTRILWGRPELRKLAKAVRHELTGK